MPISKRRAAARVCAVSWWSIPRVRRGFGHGLLKLAPGTAFAAQLSLLKNRERSMQPDPHVVYQNETIVAIATPPGRGGIGIVRLSGPEATRIAEPMLRLRNPLAHAQARFADLLDLDTQEKLDEAVVTFFAAPHSYTGEDVVEVAAHGSPVILETLVRQALKGGARLAAPGEFTQRAFLSGRIDLTQAEAVHDLIEAQTLYQARVAAQQLHGALSRRIKPIKEGLVALIALLEAGIDFAEDDVDVLPGDEILSRIDEHSLSCCSRSRTALPADALCMRG